MLCHGNLIIAKQDTSVVDSLFVGINPSLKKYITKEISFDGGAQLLVDEESKTGCLKCVDDKGLVVVISTQPNTNFNIWRLVKDKVLYHLSTKEPNISTDMLIERFNALLNNPITI